MDRSHTVLLLAWLVVTAAMFAAPAHAEPEVQISIGTNTSTVDVVPFAPGALTNLPVDEFGGTGLRIGFGISWGGQRAFEVGSSRFGSTSGVEIRPYTPPPGAAAPGPTPAPTIVPAKQSGSAYWIAYTPSWRHGPLSLTAKLGVAQVRRMSASLDDPPTIYRERGPELLLGGAVTHRFGDRFGVRLDVERMSNTATQVGLSVNMRF